MHHASPHVPCITPSMRIRIVYFAKKSLFELEMFQRLRAYVRTSFACFVFILIFMSICLIFGNKDKC